MGNANERLEGARKVEVLVAQSYPTLCSPWTIAHRTSLPMGFSRQECWSGMGHHVFLQGIFPTQRSNSHLLYLLHWHTGSLPLVPHIRVCVCVCVCVLVSPLSHVQFLVTLWAVAHQAPLSIKFSQARILEWVTIPSPGDLPDPRKTKMGYFSPLFSVLGCFSSNGYHCCLGPTPTRSSPPCFLILWVNLAPEIWLHCPFL